MAIYCAVVAIIFGPLCLAAFIRTLAARCRPPLPKDPPQRRMPSERWAAPERTVGQHWKN